MSGKSEKPSVSPVDPKVVRLVEYIVDHAEAESRLLTPNPQHFLGVMGLLDAIVDIFEVSKADMGRLVDDAHDTKSSRRRKR